MDYTPKEPLFNPETRELNTGIIPKSPVFLLMFVAVTSLGIAYYNSFNYYYFALTVSIAIIIQKPLLRRLDLTVEQAFKLTGLFFALQLLGIPFLIFL